MMTVEAYHQMLRALLPRGKIWDELGPNLDDLLRAMARELLRIDIRVGELIAEANPASTSELAANWLKSLGLPGPYPLPLTVPGMRALIIARLTENAAPTEQRAHALAALAGYTISITKYWEPFTCVSECTHELYTDAWHFVWDVTAASGSDDALLTSLMTNMDPEHTLVRVFFT